MPKLPKKYTHRELRSTRNDAFHLSPTRLLCIFRKTFIICTEGQLVRVWIFHKHTWPHKKNLLSFYSVRRKWDTFSSQSTENVIYILLSFNNVTMTIYYYGNWIPDNGFFLFINNQFVYDIFVKNVHGSIILYYILKNYFFFCIRAILFQTIVPI